MPDGPAESWILHLRDAPVRMLTDEEVAELREAIARPGFLEGLPRDPAGMVEVDNPIRREVRPRRGREETNPAG